MTGGPGIRARVVCGRRAGFTLIELVVVISLISLMLVFSMPRLQSAILTDPMQKSSRVVVGQVQSLKERARKDRTFYTLHVDVNASTLWVTHGAMTEEEQQNAERNAGVLSSEIRILDVELPGQGKVSTGQAEIYFTDMGYSSKAMIHVEDDHRNQRSFLIEPFLPRVKIFETYRGFQD